MSMEQLTRRVDVLESTLSKLMLHNLELEFSHALVQRDLEDARRNLELLGVQTRDKLVDTSRDLVKLRNSNQSLVAVVRLLLDQDVDLAAVLQSLELDLEVQSHRLTNLVVNLTGGR